MVLHAMISLVPETQKSYWLYIEEKYPTLVFFQQVLCDQGDND